ncbi:MAG: TIGR03619 family F420-dependent LLM class oxidoreductase [Dietzia sp.]
MRLGISTPAVTVYPPTASEWEHAAGIEDIARIAVAADELGYHHLTCSEHVAVPADIAAVRGGTYWDPLATLGYVAALTTRIRLATQVLVLGYHHPLEIAKRYGTLDAVSGGRLILGLGVGSLEQEFDLLGAPFADRGARADDALAALRASLSVAEPEYHGRFHDYSGLIVRPHAVQDRVPLWIGGRTRRSLRRALDHGDGWVPFGLSLPDMESMLAGAAEARSSSSSPSPAFDVVLSPDRMLDPLGDPAATARALEAVARAGATITGVSITARDASHYCDQLAELRELAAGEGHEFAPISGPGRK